LERWIDMHCHILPEVDDGAQSIEQTINMLIIAHEEGILHIIATPHYRAGYPNPDYHELEQKLETVRQEALKIDRSFRIDLGNELYYSQDILEHLNSKKALTMAGTRYVLVEFLVDVSYMNLRAGLHNLLINGYLPILAHMERYQCLYHNYNGIQELQELGIYLQMNISSVIGNITNRRASFCRKLIEKGYIHFISTDSHSDQYRAPRIKQGADVIRKKYGEDSLSQLLSENATKMLNNQYI
jgi:protein-tyrosine phosphatase